MQRSRDDIVTKRLALAGLLSATAGLRTACRFLAVTVLTPPHRHPRCLCLLPRCPICVASSAQAVRQGCDDGFQAGIAQPVRAHLHPEDPRRAGQEGHRLLSGQACVLHLQGTEGNPGFEVPHDLGPRHSCPWQHWLCPRQVSAQFAAQGNGRTSAGHAVPLECVSLVRRRRGMCCVESLWCWGMLGQGRSGGVTGPRRRCRGVLISTTLCRSVLVRGSGMFNEDALLRRQCLSVDS